LTGGSSCFPSQSPTCDENGMATYLRLLRNLTLTARLDGQKVGGCTFVSCRVFEKRNLSLLGSQVTVRDFDQAMTCVKPHIIVS
jgi:hypothetical protein